MVGYDWNVSTSRLLQEDNPQLLSRASAEGEGWVTRMVLGLQQDAIELTAATEPRPRQAEESFSLFII